MVPKTQPPIKFSEITPLVGGKELSGMTKMWEDVAVSETRLNLLARLQDKRLGFNEVEKFALGFITAMAISFCISHRRSMIYGP